MRNFDFNFGRMLMDEVQTEIQTAAANNGGTSENNPANDTVVIGNRTYRKDYVKSFAGVIKSVSYCPSYAEWLEKRIAEITEEKGDEEAAKWADRAPSFKLAITLTGIDGSRIQPVREYDAIEGKLMPSNVIYLYDYDVRAAFGKNEIIRNVANKAIFKEGKADSLLGTYIEGVQIAVPQDTAICNPYAGIHATPFTFTKHVGVINVLDDIKVVPYGPINGFPQKKLVLDYAVAMALEADADSEEIMYLLDKKNNVKYVDDEARELIVKALRRKLKED